MTKPTPKLFEEGLEIFPLKTMVAENILFLFWILLGSYLCASLSKVVGWAYLIYGSSMLIVFMRILVCKNCYYHGKWCHSGWGKLSALYCKQGEITRFGCGAGGAIIPIFYGSMALIPIILAVITLIKSFSILILGILVLFIPVVALSSTILRKKVCVQCKMKNLCPGSLGK